MKDWEILLTSSYWRLLEDFVTSVANLGEKRDFLLILEILPLTLILLSIDILGIS